MSLDHTSAPLKRESFRFFIENILGQFSENGIQFALLQNPPTDPPPSKIWELDLLLNPAHLSILTKVLRKTDFMEIPSWGHQPHHFWISYLESPDVWVKLDVVTQVSVGTPVRFLTLKHTNHLFPAQNVLKPPGKLDTESRILIELLKFSGNTDSRKEPRERWLSKEFRVLLSEREQLERTLRKFEEQGIPQDVVRDFITSFCQPDRRSPETERRKLLWALFWSNPLGSFHQLCAVCFAKLLRPLARWSSSSGFLAILMAPDGAGKTTLAQGLSEDPVLRCEVFYMGKNLNSMTQTLPTTKRLAAWKGKGGAPMRLVLSLNELVDFIYRTLLTKRFVARGRFVVHDRMDVSAITRRASKSLFTRIRRELIRRIAHAPDVIFLLDAPGEVLFSRKREHSPEFLERQRQDLQSLQAILPNMETIDASQPIDRVRRLVTRRIWDLYREKVHHA